MKVITVTQLAAFLGVTTRTAQRLVKAGKVETCMVGEYRLVLSDSAEAYAAERQKLSQNLDKS